MAQLGGRQPYTLVLRDYSDHTKSIRLYTNEITAVSLPGLLTELGTFRAAIEGVTLGVVASDQWGEETIRTNLKATVKDAQIETEMLVRCHGATTEAPFSFRIPCVDYEAFNFADPPAGDSVIISGAGASAATLALVTAIQTTFKMPNDETEALVVDAMEVVR